MILNDRQLSYTKKKIKDFQDALEKIDDGNPLGKMKKNAINSTLSDFHEDISFYEDALVENKIFDVKYEIEDFKKNLVAKRINSRKTQEEISNEIGVSLESFVRMESEVYSSVELSTLIEISYLVGLNVEEIYLRGKTIYKKESSFDSKPKRIISEIRNLMKSLSSPDSDKIFRSFESRFFENSKFNSMSLHKKTISSHKDSKKASLLAWETIVKIKAQEEIKKRKQTYFENNFDWVEKIRQFTLLEDGPLKVRDFLADKGITLVIMPHLKMTYLDGAALRSKEGFPIIGMSLRHDRVDNFWFVLLHEIAHLHLHMYNGKDNYIEFTEEKVKPFSDDELEKDANDFSKNMLIPEHLWKKCFSRIKPTEVAVKKDANKIGIHPAILAGMIRYEKNDYKILSNLINGSKVRRNFGDIQW